MSPTTFKSTFLPVSRRLYVVAWRLLGNAQDAEDLVQETMMKLWDKRNELSGVENAEAFSVTMLNHIFIDNRRRQHLKETDVTKESLHVVAEDDTIKAIERSETADRVKQLIDDLPQQQRKVITMRDINDSSFEEIGEVTGLSQNNIRSLLSRARKSIREKMQDEE
jgi:RNA polymerase sigma factor (sigma-70 family)